MVSGCLFIHLGWHFKGKFSCAVIKSATTQVCVKCSWSLFPVFFLLWEGQIATERKVGGWGGLPLMGKISWFVVGYKHTNGNTHAHDQITQWSQDAICQRTGNGIHLSNLLRRSSNCADIAVFVIWGGLPNWLSWYGVIAADKWATTNETSNVFLLLSFTKHSQSHGCKQYLLDTYLIYTSFRHP